MTETTALDALEAARRAWETAGRPGAQAQLQLAIPGRREADIHRHDDRRRRPTRRENR